MKRPLEIEQDLVVLGFVSQDEVFDFTLKVWEPLKCSNLGRDIP